MLTDVRPERVTLYFRQGGSDKVYLASIEPKAAGFVVTFAYGRRGSTLTTGTKTATPVAYDAAKAVYEKLVKEKTAKGYTPGAAGTPYAGTERGPRAVAGVLPQLCNPVDEAGAAPLLADDRWWLQEKFDGRRVLIRKDGDAVVGINRTGLTTGLPRPVVDAVRQLDADRCLLDGEAVGDLYVTFDLLEQATLDLRPCPFYARYDRLLNLVDAVPSDALRYAETATTTATKRATLDRLRRERREGVVLKRSASAYTPGRPASGGDWLKLKFTATASCLVAGVNAGRRSVRLELVGAGAARVGVGSVTIPTGRPVPPAGRVVEVRYLYAHCGGSLFQPVYLGERDDVGPHACTVAQLKFKATAGDDDVEPGPVAAAPAA